MPAGLVASTLPDSNGELADGSGRGDTSSRKGRRGGFTTTEKGRSRNVVAPDSLYDALCLYALKTKIKVPGKKRRDEYYRSLTVSEASCDAWAMFLKSKGITVGESEKPAE